MDLRPYIRDIPDFPKPGILFRDLCPLVGNPDALRETIDELAAPWRAAGITKVVGIESRGFIFGASVAYRIGAGFALVRKPGKLPGRTNRAAYALEYGHDSLEIHQDGLTKRDRVLVVDDLLATGGTMAATLELVRGLGAEVAGCGFVVELTGLSGRSRLGKTRVETLLRLP
jgi:adenine phosphoribosyltransferase